MVETAENIVAEHKNFKVNPLSLKFPHFYRFWEFPTNLNFVPTNWLKFPKLGKFPQSSSTDNGVPFLFRKYMAAAALCGERP